MSSLDVALPAPKPVRARPLGPLATLARRRFQLTVHTPRELFAGRAPRQEEYSARVPAIAILPWFLAGSLFPIAALPAFLTWIAKFLPLTHALAVMRYGLLQDTGGLHAIWGMHDAAAMAALSVGVVGAFAALAGVAAVRVFSRTAVG